MRWVLLIGLAWLAAVAETSLVDAMRIGQVTPDLLAMVAIVWLLAVPGRWAFLAAGAVTLVGDLIAPGRPGIGAAWMLLIGYGLTRLKTWLAAEHLAVEVPAVFAAASLWTLGVSATCRVLGDVPLPWSALPMRAAGVGLYTAAVSLPILMVLDWIREPSLKRERTQRVLNHE